VEFVRDACKDDTFRTRKAPKIKRILCKPGAPKDGEYKPLRDGTLVYLVGQFHPNFPTTIKWLKDNIK
jgi:hypothetical protein